MVGWHHQLDGHDLVMGRGAWCATVHGMSCSLWGHRELHMTERLKWSEAALRPIKSISGKQERDLILGRACIFVCYSCHNKAPQAEWQTEVYLLTVLEARSSRSRCVHALLRPLSCAASSHDHVAVCVVCVPVSSSYKDTGPSGWELIFMPSFYRNFPF